MDTQKAQIVDRLKQANNILVTVSANPTVDQLSAAIGTTLMLNKLGKHATAVFSGKVPSVLEFLEPAKTLETNTDSLRDFIISLDKNKADKLRYKVEDNHVRIFITPYRTSISDKDLVFSQGDFNVEVVLALGISKQQDLDKAIAAHGRILHDATVVDISLAQVSGLGTMNLIDPSASSLCEIMVDIGVALKPDVLDAQMATSFLTGIVAQTNRFSNAMTTSRTMEMSSKLLAAGANQQLVATKLQPPKPPTPPPAPATPKPAAPKPNTPANVSLPEPASLPEPEPEKDKPAADGTLEIDHGPAVDLDTYELSEEDPDAKLNQIHIDDQGQLKTVDPNNPAPSPEPTTTTGHKVLQPLSSSDSSVSEQKPSDASTVGPTGLTPPTLGGTLTASGTVNETEQAINPMVDNVGANQTPPPLLNRGPSTMPSATDDQASAPANSATPAPESATDEVLSNNTLTDIERSVQSPHLQPPQSTVPAQTSTEQPSSAPPVGISVDEARDAVNNLTAVSPNQALPPIEALGANYVDLPGVGGTPDTASTPPQPANPIEQPSTTPEEAAQTSASSQTDTAPQTNDPTAPPPVPPPMMPPSFTPST